MFIETNANPFGANIDDCIIRAITLATEKDYQEVFDGLCNIADEKEWDIDELRTMDVYLKSLGWESYEIDGYIPTVKQYANKFTDPSIVIVRGHATFTKDGNVYDTWSPNRYKVRYVFKKCNA